MRAMMGNARHRAVFIDIVVAVAGARKGRV
jgi:hypothetical protein